MTRGAGSFRDRSMSTRPTDPRPRRTAKRSGTAAEARPNIRPVVIQAPGAMLEASRRWRSAGRSIGLIPTMGALHAGHLSLVDAGRRENEIVVVSIFVNPIQFGPNEDFARYPRDPERDAVLLGEAGVDAIYEPPIAAMYPPGASTRVRVGGVAEPLEGKARPGDFGGGGTVVTKPFAAGGAGRAPPGPEGRQQGAGGKQLLRALD